MKGILAYFKTISKISELRLVKYLLLSGLLSLLIGAGVTSLSLSFSDDLGSWLVNLYPWETGSGVIGSISNWSSGIAIFLLGLFLLKYLLLIILSPIMSVMSEGIERKLNANFQSPKFTLSNAVSDILRSLLINVRNLTKELLITLVLLVLSFIPGVAIVTTPLIFIVQAYYAGFGLLDYWMERHYKVRESVQYVRSNRLNAVGIGSVYLLILLVPIAGFMIAPVLGAAAATIYAVDKA